MSLIVKNHVEYDIILDGIVDTAPTLAIGWGVDVTAPAFLALRIAAYGDVGQTVKFAA